MAKHRDKAEDDEGSFQGEVQEGKLKEQLADRAPKGDGIGDSSLSPIETW